MDLTRTNTGASLGLVGSRANKYKPCTRHYKTKIPLATYEGHPQDDEKTRKSGLRERLLEWVNRLGDGDDRLFPEAWDGTDDAEALKKATARLSLQFTHLFDHALCEDLREHDLRHEATCRWVLMRDSKGGWMFRETEIIRMMGWTGIAMFLRYASLRASDLGNRLYETASVE